MAAAKIGGEGSGVLELVHPKSKAVVRVPYGPGFRDGADRTVTLVRFRERGYLTPDEAKAAEKAKADAEELAKLRAEKASRK